MPVGPQRFDPSALARGEEVDVATEDLATHPNIWRDERDPKLGGLGAGINQRGLDAMVPGHRVNLAEGQFADIDTYFSELAHSMKTHGQKEPMILSKQPDDTYWLSEGNHRLAAAQRHGIPTVRVQRGPTLRENERFAGIDATMSVRGPTAAPIERSKRRR